MRDAAIAAIDDRDHAASTALGAALRLALTA